MRSWESRGTYVTSHMEDNKGVEFLFVLKIVTEIRFWKFGVYFRTFRFEIFSIPKLRVRKCRASQAVGIFRHSWSNDTSGNSGCYIHGFVYSGIELSCLPYSADLFLMILLWQPPKWEVWNKHSWAEGKKPWISEILNIQKRKRNLRNHEYPPQAHGEA